jgi:hypothetical protein
MYMHWSEITGIVVGSFLGYLFVVSIVERYGYKKWFTGYDPGDRTFYSGLTAVLWVIAVPIIGALHGGRRLADHLLREKPNLPKMKMEKEGSDER